MYRIWPVLWKARKAKGGIRERVVSSSRHYDFIIASLLGRILLMMLRLYELEAENKALAKKAADMEALAETLEKRVAELEAENKDCKERLRRMAARLDVATENKWTDGAS